ncbi:alpha/beta fold hydrolase [Nonomuraea sp. LPB2021202275-12-8]|uniref:alpha/beta fold hydrolase n=1 Tax=Nonomuraea sp. LPB2021202275-12-8 TaxID=3120159 RepID=UPI00300C190C
MNTRTVTSKDGTTIAYERIGQGPPVILVDGAMCYRASGPNGPLAKELADSFTVYTYDRRGRGESGDTAPFAPEREIEDLAALIGEAGAPVFLYGISSGAGLALAAVESGLPVSRLAVYEPPFVVDGTRPPIPGDYTERIEAFLAAGQPGKAIGYFMRKGVNLPAPIVAMMRFMPGWSGMKEVARTLPYDAAFVTDFEHGKPLPDGQWDSIKVPTLAVDGGKSPAWIRNGVKDLARVLPNAEHRTLDGQTHMVKPQALAPVLKGFFQ